jgi:hypothetical protein
MTTFELRLRLIGDLESCPDEAFTPQTAVALDRSSS